MAWQVRHSRTFLKELARLPVGVRNQVEAVVFGKAIKDDPYLGGRVEKMVIASTTKYVSVTIG